MVRSPEQDIRHGVFELISKLGWMSQSFILFV